eukprot:CAMPEP_0174833034 /NCGR_PEP_ID=MMETSP1114-20130205/3992_1 /TAXON_ID=312471 /ORGANISM="Neobodo designis, Strain CCAP 1951/1" /LENGTH=876 /DNA_ID=CAMNT_0016066905 /DNA_START=47 /DNA_END=2677 /DNA_ORIENTATION=+
MSRMPSESVTSTMRGASESMSRTSKVRADAKRKAMHSDKHGDAPLVIKDPDDKSIIRTPKPLLKPEQPRNLVRRGVAATGSDRRASVQTGGEGGSVSIRTSRSEERSVSHANEGSSSSSEQFSTSTPDDFTADMLDGSTSDSHSTMERSSVSGPAGRRQSQISSSEGPSMAGHGAGDHGGEKRAEAAPAVGRLMSSEPRLHVLERNLGRAPQPKHYDHQAMGEWKRQEAFVTLTETPMMFLFEKKDEAVANAQTPEAEEVRKRNDRYEAFLKAKRENETGGKYLEKGVTTLNEPAFVFTHEAQHVQTANSGAVQVTTYDLHDEMLRATEEEVEADEGVKAETQRDGDDDAGRADGDDEGGDGEEEGGDGAAGGGGSSSPKKRRATWLSSPSLLETVLIVERCIVMNNYEELQLAYRGIAMEPLTDHVPVADAAKPSSPTEGAKKRRDYTSTLQSEERDALEEKRAKEEAREKQLEEELQRERRDAKAKILWTFGGESTRGKNVSCLAWNRRNTDILAAGYGEYGVPGTDDTSARGYGGVVNCWSVKNPFTPERSIKIESDAGVSAMHFSKQFPSLLAVGNTDGTLALYDVRAHGNAPALKTTMSTGQHTGTIWEVRWVDKGQERGETLVSISADGHVMEWSIKKGLERTADLMKLKRAPSSGDSGGQSAAIPGKGGAPKEALLARQSGGMCFDMHPRESITYVVGTEDGTIHKCSKSQNENYVSTYKPHGEPVYRIRWNQFCPDYFLTGSADWTSRLYYTDKPDPVATYDSNSQDAVQDLCWSHSNATVFATATAQGHVDVWDVADPNKVQASLPLGKPLNCLVFAEQESPLLTCGDATGDVSVVKLVGEEFERNGRTDAEQERRFRDVVAKVSVA